MGGLPGGQMGGPGSGAPQPAAPAPAPEPVPLAPIPVQHIEIQVKYCVLLQILLFFVGFYKCSKLGILFVDFFSSIFDVF